MKGSIRNRGGKRQPNGSYKGGSWTAYWRETLGGAAVQRAKGGFATKAAAQDFLNGVLTAIKDGTYVPPTKTTFGEFLLEMWLPAQRQRLRDSTYEDYERRIRQHIVPALGSVPIQDLGAFALDRLYADLLSGGSSRGGGLSPKSVRNVHIVVRKALRDAARKQIVTRNVAVDADPPRISGHGDSNLPTWKPEELRTFLDGVREHHLAPAFVLAASTGMRRGEVLGLSWEDVDLESRTITIRRTLLSVAYRITPGEPKTARGRRIISIDAGTAAVLRAHRAEQAQQATLVGRDTMPDDFVFSRPDGSPIHPDLFTKTFDRNVKRLGLRRVRLHDLRHTYATLALRAGVDAKTVSSRLGHATVAFTLDVYTRAVPQLDRSAADRVADLIFGTGPPGDTDEDDDDAK